MSRYSTRSKIVPEAETSKSKDDENLRIAEDQDDDETDTESDEYEDLAEEIETKAKKLFGSIPDDENSLNGVSDQYFLRKNLRYKKKEDGFFDSFESESIDEKGFQDAVLKEYRQICQELKLDKPDMILHYQMLIHNFNIVLYGYGSKITVLNDFIQRFLSDKHHYIVVRGYSPDITLKDIINILNKTINNDTNITDHDALIESLNETFSNSLHPLFVVIHSLDRLVQDRKNQMKSFLVKLFSQAPNVRFISTADIVNFELMFTTVEIGMLKLQMMPLNTYEPYLEERRTISGQSTASRSKAFQMSLNLSSVRYVYESLNDNAKKIFVIIVKHLLQGKFSKTSGLKFDELYRICREEFLSSSVTTVRQQLTEFKDHKLLKFKTDTDGSETILLCFQAEVARKFLESIDEE